MSAAFLLAIGLVAPGWIWAGDDAPRLPAVALDDPRFRIALDALYRRHPAEALPHLAATLSQLDPADPGRPAVQFLLALAHLELGEHAAFHAEAEPLVEAAEPWGELARLLLLVDHLDRGAISIASRFATREISDPSLRPIHHLAAALVLAASGSTAPARKLLTAMGDDPELGAMASTLEGWLASPPRMPLVEAQIADSLAAAERAMKEGRAVVAAQSFAAAAERAQSLHDLIDAGARPTAMRPLPARDLAAGLHPLMDRDDGTSPLAAIDEQALEGRILGRAFAHLDVPPPPPTALPLLRRPDGAHAGGQAISPARFPAPALLDSSETAAIASRLETLRLRLGEQAAFQRLQLENRARADALIEHRARLDALRAMDAGALAAATADLERAHNRTDQAGKKLDDAVRLAVGRAQAHFDSVLAVAEKLQAADRGLMALFPPPEAKERPEPPFFAIDRLTLARDLENLDHLVTALARARAALEGVVAAHVRGDQWPAVVKALADAQSIAERTRAIAGPLDSDPRLAPFALAAMESLSTSRSEGERLNAAVDLAARDLVAAIAEADRAACARARSRLAELSEGGRFGEAEALYRLARQFGPIGPEMAADGGPPTPAEAALRRAALAFETFIAGEPRGPGAPAAWLRLGELRLQVAELDFRRSMANYLAAERRGESAGSAPVRDTGGAAAAATAFLARFPDHPGADRALYNLGVLARESGDRAQSTSFFDQLRSRWPRSRLAAEAALRIGDNHFEAEDFVAAEAAYALIAGHSSRLGTAALYKLGWCRLNRGNPSGAAAAFADLLERDLDPAIRDDAEITLARCLADQGGADAAESFFAARPSASYGPAVFIRLAQELANRSHFESAVAAARAGAIRYSSERELAQLLEVEIGILDRAGRSPEAAHARIDFARRIGPGGSWFARHGSDSLATAASVTMLRGADQLMALAQGEDRSSGGSDEGWAAARGAYREYIDRFPRSEAIDRAELMLAECEMNLNRPLAAAANYSHVAVISRDPSRARQAAYGAVVAWERARGPASSDSTHLRQELKAIDIFVERFGSDPRTPDLLMRRGAVTFAAGRLDEAAKSYAQLVATHPESPYRVRALRSQADAELNSGRPADAAETYARLVSGPPASTRADSALVSEAGGLLMVARFRAAEALVAGGHPAGGARAFVDLADRYPDFKQADLALLRAAEAYRQAGDIDNAATTYRRLVDQHPKSPNRAPALLRLATLQAEAGQTGLAARGYLRFAVDYPDSSAAPAALVESRALARRASDWELMEAAARTYLDRTGTVRASAADRSEGALAARLDLAEALIARGRSTDARPELDRALASPAASAEEVVVAAHAHLLRAQLQAPEYRRLAIAPPVVKAIEKKKAALTGLIADLEPAIKNGDEADQAVAGELLGSSLAEFGRTLEESETPSDLADADLVAYTQAIAEQADNFYRRAEAVWRQAIERARASRSENPAIADIRRQLFARYDRRYSELARATLPEPQAENPLRAMKPQEVKNAADSGVAAAR